MNPLIRLFGMSCFSNNENQCLYLETFQTKPPLVANNVDCTSDLFLKRKDFYEEKLKQFRKSQHCIIDTLNGSWQPNGTKMPTKDLTTLGFARNSCKTTLRQLDQPFAELL
jgi:hypothetical protein